VRGPCAAAISGQWLLAAPQPASIKPPDHGDKMPHKSLPHYHHLPRSVVS